MSKTLRGFLWLTSAKYRRYSRTPKPYFAASARISFLSASFLTDCLDVIRPSLYLVTLRSKANPLLTVRAPRQFLTELARSWRLTRLSPLGSVHRELSPLAYPWDRLSPPLLVTNHWKSSIYTTYRRLWDSNSQNGVILSPFGCVMCYPQLTLSFSLVKRLSRGTTSNRQILARKPEIDTTSGETSIRNLWQA